MALITLDDVFTRATIQGASEQAKSKGLQVVSVDAYPSGTTDFSVILERIRTANPDVLAVSTLVLDDAV